MNVLPFPALPGGTDTVLTDPLESHPTYATFPPVLAPEECTEDNPWMCLVGLHPIVCDSGEVMSPNGPICSLHLTV
jgi:hypothetical protein